MSQLISVVVTAYNIEKYLKKCLDSVLRQTYRNIEVLIVDDGSVDGTGKIAKECAQKNENVNYFYQENAGVSVARNLGMEHASGKYIMFVDGDDYLDPQIIEELYGKINGSEIICCCCKAFDEKNFYVDHFFSTSFIAKNPKEKERLFLQLLNGNEGKTEGKGYTAIGVPWGKLYNIRFLRENNITFDPKLKRMQDNMFNLNAFYYANQVSYVNQPLYYYRLEHVKSKENSYGLEVWEPLLTTRKEFFYQHKEMLTKKLEGALFYEKNIGFISVALHIVGNRNTSLAVKELTNVRNNSLFIDLFNNNVSCKLPLRIKVFRNLARFHLYYILIMCIRIKSK